MRPHVVALAACLLALVLAGPASAAEPYRAVKGSAGPGPAKYDKVFVQRFGPAKAKRVLVLVPGFVGGAGDFRLMARNIVKRVPGLQVWAYDRREQAFEDTSVFRKGDPAKALDYYLGFKFKRVDPKKSKYVSGWGLKLALNDLRKVVLKARKGGKRKVILGGHSLGASTAVAYSSWDFNGRPGYKDLSGLVLIDGGLLGSFDSTTLANAKKVLRAAKAGEVFDDLLQVGVPEAAGVLSELAALNARKLPNAVSPLQSSPIIPSYFKPPFPVTNEAALGYAFDENTSPPVLSLIRINSGRLAATGNPRPWEDGGITPIQRFAELFSAEQPNATEWYFPRRLRLDVDAASPLKRTKVTKYLGLRPFHAKEVKLPLYVFQTDLTKGRVLKGARRFIKRSRIKSYTLVTDTSQNHLDPLVASPSKNRFLSTLTKFLKKHR